MTFFCIADEDTLLGFRLAGVSGQAVATSDEAASAIEKAISHPDYSVIIITQQIAALIREKIRLIRFERDRPLIVEIPGPRGDMPDRRSLRQFVQEAVGISVGQGGS